ncbi:MAG: hypothetical protein PHY93_05805 [Bacteriovorax sp.]|nr:hypothetical protein [Bacteriovorax sp.]
MRKSIFIQASDGLRSEVWLSIFTLPSDTTTSTPPPGFDPTEGAVRVINEEFFFCSRK